MRRPLLLAIIVALVAGCGAAARAPRLLGPCTFRDARCADTVSIRSLGVAGFVIRRGSHTLITGPSITNPKAISVLPGIAPFLRWMLPRAEPDQKRIEQALGGDLGVVEGILVGQGHYDHALDTRVVAGIVAPQATVIASKTTVNMLLGDPLFRARTGAVEAIDAAHEADGSRPGQWYYTRNRGFRVLPLRADHAPNFKPLGLDILYAKGTVTAPMSKPPRTAAHWKVGEPYAFLIDVLAEGSDDDVLMRIYYQDSANSDSLGFPPQAELANRGADVAILCVASAQHVKSPAALLGKMKASTIIGSHWEDFFGKPRRGATKGLSSDTIAFRARAEAAAGKRATDTTWFIPVPQDTLLFGVRRAR